MSQSLQEDSPVDQGPARSAVANAIVRLYAEHYGRGPTRAKAYLMDDVVLVLLEDVFTTAERTLIANGHGAQVTRSRAAFNDALGRAFTAAVEEVIGRRVRTAFSQTSLEPEMVAELFVLEPEAG